MIVNRISKINSIITFCEQTKDKDSVVILRFLALIERCGKSRHVSTSQVFEKFSSLIRNLMKKPRARKNTAWNYATIHFNWEVDEF